MCNTPRHSSWRDVCAAGAWLLSNISAALSRSKATQKCFVYCLKSKALPVCLSATDVSVASVASAASAAMSVAVGQQLRDMGYPDVDVAELMHGSISLAN